MSKVTTLIEETRGLLAKLEVSVRENERLKIEAGRRLLDLHKVAEKQGTPWKRYLSDNGLCGKSYAYELMKCARGAQTVREMRDRANARERKSQEKTVRQMTDTCDTGCNYDPDAEVEGEAPEVSRRRGNLWRMQVTAEDAERIHKYYLEFPNESDNKLLQASIDAADAWSVVRDLLRKQLKSNLRVVK
jgi:hypothetical protein